MRLAVGQTQHPTEADTVEGERWGPSALQNAVDGPGEDRAGQFVKPQLWSL